MSLGSDYEDAVRGGNTPLANYLAQMLAANAGINIAANQVEAAPASFFPDKNTTPSAGGDGGFWGGLGKFPLLPGLPGLTPDAIGSVIGGVGDAAKGAGSAISFITDIPRVATTILGLILVIAGIFALTRGPAVNIVSNAVSKAVTS